MSNDVQTKTSQRLLFFVNFYSYKHNQDLRKFLKGEIIRGNYFDQIYNKSTKLQNGYSKLSSSLTK